MICEHLLPPIPSWGVRRYCISPKLISAHVFVNFLTTICISARLAFDRALDNLLIERRTSHNNSMTAQGSVELDILELNKASLRNYYTQSRPMMEVAE